MVFFNIEERDNGDFIWNGFPIEKIAGSGLKINEEIYGITTGVHKVLTDTSYIPIKKLKDKDRELFNNISESFDFENYKAIRCESKSGRYKQSNTIFKKFNLTGHGIEKNIIPSNINDIYTRLEILVGLKLSGHTDTLTEASNLKDEIYKRGEIQNKQQNRNALNKFPTLLMELPGKLLEHIAFKTRSRTEEHMLNVMDKSTHGEHLSQP